jgi:transposase
LRKKGKPEILKKTRWIFLKNKSKLKREQRGRLRELVKAERRAYLLKEDFRHFWTYSSVLWAARFFDRWCTMAMRSRLGPIKKVVRTLRRHRALILNWIGAKNTFAMGATEGYNEARSTMKRAYGFRTPAHAEIALFDAMGKLSEPQWLAHKFW